MKISSVAIGFAVLMFLSGCVSAERKAEYAAWKASDDGDGSVTLEMFESQYKSGWRERAEHKKETRLLQEEYNCWLCSDDYVPNVTIEVFEQRYKQGWKSRAEQKKQVRLAEEEAERVEKERKETAERAEKERLAMRTALYEKTVEHDLAAIKECYSNGNRYMNPFLGKCQRGRDENVDWLAKWAFPRLGISEADALAGEALLSAFGTKYLPNAYANYEKKRDALVEFQQVFNEEFSSPWTIKPTNPKWNSFTNVLEKFVKVRTEFFFCHDELCHYWLLNRFAVLLNEDFVMIDAKRLAVHLLPENIKRAEYTFLKPKPMEGKISDFAFKYAPESNAMYQKMKREFMELDVLLTEVFGQRIKMDDVRYSHTLTAAVAKRNDLVREMNMLSLRLQEWYIDHKTTGKSSEDVAKCDDEMRKQLKPFMDALPSYIKEHALGSIIPNLDMKTIPKGQIDVKKSEWGRWDKKRRWKTDRHEKKREWTESEFVNIKMQRMEVTQLQWMMVMGNNPSYFLGPDRPVENVSYNDCQEFIKRVSQIDGREYRLPNEAEWTYACRAGGTINLDTRRKKRGGNDTLTAMNCYSESLEKEDCTHAVASRFPNAYGLFDMQGNVREWCANEFVNRNSPERHSRCIVCGGSYYGGSGDQKTYNVDKDKTNCNIGFRLAISN